ncbi:hypothetical protein L1987_44680 [Smallanthus sonchifolius]|uniref:Uncharacterized protein n=1 Tax=Smallanthus sonchifolius TaxID=185202 RepID=A0ACB9GR55_9ASTR|nr:hypothetical protein L1987_44680 [Smallanthus sonchifolius]
MEDNKDIQIQVKKIPAFTVLKNGSILKNIFLLRKKSSQNQESDEEILLVGRHPDCHITLEHPSISRYHLRIHSNPSSHILSLVDLSSVHGTWVSGRRIEPGVHVTLKEGDTVKIGGSSRVYELHWVPLTQAYNVDEQFVPAVYTIKEGEEEEETHQVDEKHEAYSLDDDLECSDLNPSTSSVPSYSSSVAEVEQSFALRTSNENDDIFAAVPIQAPLVVSETVSATQAPLVASEAVSETESSDCPKESEDELDWLRDNLNMDQEKTLTPDISKAKEIHMNIQSMQNGSASMKLFDSSGGKELEFYTPDKENKNPNACSGESFSKKAVISTIYGEKDIFGFSQKLFVTDEGMDRKQEVDPFVNCEEVLAPSGKENKSRQMIMEGSCNSISYPQTVQKVLNSSQILAKKRWTMVVDTNSLLDHKSFKHLKLLEGIGGTRLFVPKLVVNELMDIKSQDSFFKRKKVSLALKWIEECMMNTRWWIHMDDEIVHSSMAVPEVLEIALHLHKQVTDKKIIILSNDLTLKIKAMAEGIICEAAEEFRESLVNPFSERFMWVGSSARGLTWSCVDDDDIVRQKYHGFGLNGSHGFKGLKLLARAKTGQLVTA